MSKLFAMPIKHSAGVSRGMSGIQHIDRRIERKLCNYSNGNSFDDDSWLWLRNSQLKPLKLRNAWAVSLLKFICLCSSDGSEKKIKRYKTQTRAINMSRKRAKANKMLNRNRNAFSAIDKSSIFTPVTISSEGLLLFRTAWPTLPWGKKNFWYHQVKVASKHLTISYRANKGNFRQQSKGKMSKIK